jgi:hypothetical protein
MINLTENEIKVIAAIINSDYQDDNNPVNNPVWSFSCNPFENKKTLSGVVASLSKKGLVNSGGTGQNACITLLQAGMDAYNLVPK